MKIQSLTIQSSADGLALSALLALPDGDIRGLVQIAHGMADHKARYQGFMEALAQAGYASLAPDHRGHGASVASEDDLGWFDAQALTDDMRQWTAHFRALYPGKPLCLFGHSMGSLAARAYVRACDEALAALVVCGCPGENPALGAAFRLAALTGAVRGARHRSRLIDHLTSVPLRRKMPGGSSALAWLNTDKGAVTLYERDRLCGFVFTVRGYQALFSLMRDAYARRGWALTKPDLPVLFISGADDPCMIDRAKLDEAVERMRAVGYRDVTLRVYDGMRHEMLLEPNRAQVYADVVAFLGRAMTQGA